MSDDMSDDIEFDVTTVMRHKALIDLWQDLPIEALISDQYLLVEFVLFRVQRDGVLIRAQLAVARGGTHDCGEWLDAARTCQLCGQGVRP